MFINCRKFLMKVHFSQVKVVNMGKDINRCDYPCLSKTGG